MMVLRINLLAVWLWALPATAGNANKLSVSGVIFSGFTRAWNAADNSFHLDRAYLNVAAPIDRRFSLRFTTDVGHLSAGDSRVRPFVKYAYTEWKSKYLKLRFGMAANGWTGFSDRFWEHRFVAKSFADQRGMIASADLGLHALGEHGKLRYQVALVNGEGYTKPEADNLKSVQLRLTYSPLAGATKLPISLYFSRPFGRGGEHRTQAATSIGWKAKSVIFWIEALIQRGGEASGEGFSSALLPSIGALGHLITRIDRWDFSTAARPDRGQDLVVGIGRKIGQNIRTALLFAQQHRNEDAPTQNLNVRLRTAF